MTKVLHDTKCAICNKPLNFRRNELSTIRQQWIDCGGWGKVPKHAIVHVVCDNREKKSKKA